MPITPWPQYADHPLALICRSRLGSYMPVGDRCYIRGLRRLAPLALGRGWRHSMQNRWIVIFVAFAMSAGFAIATESNAVTQFANAISGQGEVRLRGIAKLNGELMIYVDRQSLDSSSKFPRCISGVFQDQSSRSLQRYSGKSVAVEGELYKYSDLPHEYRELIPRRILAGSVIPNFCFGSSVLLLKSIELAD